MGQEYLKTLVRDAPEGTLGVICSVVMRIIHTNQPYALAIAVDFPGIVDEHYQAGFFQINCHFNAVMVAQHAKDAVIVTVHGEEDGAAGGGTGPWGRRSSYGYRRRKDRDPPP